MINYDVVIENCTNTSTVDWLKSVVKKELDIQESGKLLRLIYLGKLLDPGTEALKNFNFIPGACVHAFVSNKQKEGSVVISSSSSSSNELNTSIHSHTTNNSNGNNESIDYRGFNRLLAIGMTHEDVAALRATFQVNIQEFRDRSQLQCAEGESEISFRLRVEDDWIAAQGRLSDFAFNLPIPNHQALFNRNRLNSASETSNITTSPPSPRVIFSSLRTPFSNIETTEESTSTDAGIFSDYLYGFIVGVTIGFLVIFCVGDRNIPFRQKIGLLAGVIVSSLLGMIQEERKGLNTASGNQHTGNAVPGGSESGSSGGSVLVSDYDSAHKYLRFQ